MKAFYRVFYHGRQALAAASLLLLGTAAQAQNPIPATRWDKSFGGTGDDRLTVVQPTADGGYILGGFSPSGIGGPKTQASFGGIDYWIVKLDAAGNRMWDKTFGGANEDRLTSLQQTADGGYILGGSSNSNISGSKTQSGRGGFDMWVLKLDAAGTKTWDQTLGSNTDDRLATVRQTADGGYIVGGQTDSGVNGDRTQPGQGGLDYWLVKLDATGAKTWDRSLGGGTNDILNAVRQAPDGGYILGGFSYSNASGDKSQNTRGSSDYDYWVIKVNSTGTKVWDRTLGGNGFDNLTSLTVGRDGSCVVGGFSNSPTSGDKTQGSRGDYDNWLVKLSPTGTKVWDYTFGGDGYDSLNGLVQTKDGGYFFGSQSNSNLSGDKTRANFGPGNTPDYWVVKVDSLGRKQWDATYGGAQDDVLTSVGQAADSTLVMGGFSSSGVSGSRTQASAGSFDYWVVKLGAPRTPTATAASQARLPLGLYPNPARAAFTVQLPADVPRAGLRLEVLDATGRTVWQQAAPAAGTTLAVAPGPLAAGLYLVRLHGAGGYQQAQRLVLE